LEGLSELEPAFKEQKAKDCVFRIYRDVRFAKDKSPYKSNFGAYFAKGGKKWNGAGYYMHFEPGNCFAGGGLWMPEASLLKAVRQEIDYNLANFTAIVTDKKFVKLFNKLEGEALKSVPQGYTADNPAAEYLKLKSYVAMHHFSDADILEKTSFKKYQEVFTTIRPLIDFLNQSLV
jgi:uncharacterized protein (TIGR02453 family)